MANFKKSMSMLTTATVLASTLAVNVSAAPATAVPNLTTDGFVGLVNNPAVAGTQQSFYLTSANYDGDVQYQIFYIDAANPNRDNPLKWTKLQDWTKPVNAKTPFQYNIPSLQAGDYSFAVRVKRAGYTADMTAGYNAAGEYDDAYPFNYTFSSKASTDVSGVKADKTSASVGDKVKISGLTGGSKYRLYSFNQATPEKWVYVTEGSSLEWAPKTAGSYVLDAQVLDASGKVVAWKLINVTVADGKAEATASTVKAVNSTTVYVTFGEAVQNVSKDDFKFDGGLTVTNAAVKQDDAKTVILTTSAQTGGTKYALSYKGNKVGDFTGASSVIPTKISITSGTVSAKVGTNAVLTADIGQKVAGVPVTFNVVSSLNSDTTKDLVGEAVTDANGIATYTYTRYVPSEDKVYAYPSGAPAVRDNVKVYWGTEARLTLTAQPTTTSVNNDTAQTYTFKLLDRDGKAIQTATSGARAWVTLAENIDSDLSNNSTATVSGSNSLTPAQNSDSHKAVEVTTDSDGLGTFTVTGNTTKATPIVYISDSDSVDYTSSNYTGSNYGPKVESDTLQLKASTITFGSSFSGYKITVDRTSTVTAAASKKADDTTSAYIFTVTKADGTVASGVNLMLGFNELMDNSLTTNTNVVAETSSDVHTVLPSATTSYAGDSGYGGDNTNKIFYRQTDSNGKAEFDFWSPTSNQIATPIAWVNLDNSLGTTREDGEPYVMAPSVSFYDAKLTGASVAYNDDKVAVTGDLVTYAANTTLGTSAGSEPIDLKYQLNNQNGDAIDTSIDSVKKVTWTISNTGSNPVNTTAQVFGGTITKTNSTTSSVILETGASTTIEVTYNQYATSAPVLRLANTNVNVADTTKKAVTLSVSAIGTTWANKTYTGNFTTNVRYAPQSKSVTGKVVGFVQAKSANEATGVKSGWNYSGQINGTTSYVSGNDKKSILRILVEVDGVSGRYAWIDTSSLVTNPYNTTTHTLVPQIVDNVKIGTDTTFDKGNYTAIKDALSADKKLKDILSVGDKVQFDGTTLYVANIN